MVLWLTFTLFFQFIKHENEFHPNFAAFCILEEGVTAVSSSEGAEKWGRDGFVEDDLKAT